MHARIIAGNRTKVKYLIGGAAVRYRSLGTWLRSAPTFVWLVVVLLLAMAARLPALGQHGLWIDEGNTYIRVALPLNLVLENLLAVRNQAPLYYLLMRLWTALLGISEFALRLPSTWCAVVNVALVYRLGSLSGRRRVGVWAALAMALNPFLVRLALEARMYTMAISLSTGAMWCFLLAVRKGGWWRWAALAIVSGMAYLTHYVTLVVGLVQFLVFLATFRTTYLSLRKWIIAQAVAVLPAAGWLALSMFSYGYTGIPGTWIPMPSLLTLPKTLWNFSLGYDGQFTPWTALGLLPFAVGLARGMWSVGERLWRWSMIVWFASPPLMAFVLSFVLRPCYLDRYLSVCVPAYLLWIVAGLTALSRATVRNVLGMLLLGAMAVSTLGILQGRRLPGADWRGAVEQVLEGVESGDRLFVDAKGFYVTFYYADHALPIERLDMASVGPVLKEALCQGGRVWLLYRDPAETCHVFDRVKTFNPYTGGRSEVGRWLVDYADQVSQEWFLDGLYLALLGPSDCTCDAVHGGEGCP